MPRKERTEEKHVEARKAYFKKLKSISLGFIEEAGLPELCCKYKACLLEKVEAVCDAYKNAEELFEYSCAVKPPFRDAGYRRSRDGVPQIV